MDVELVKKQLSACRNRAEMEAWVHANAGTPVKGKLSRSATREVEGHLRYNRRSEAATIALAYLLVDADGWIAALRRGSVLRASKYGFNPGGPREIVELLLRLAVEFTLSEQRIRYLHSLLALYSLASEARRTRDGLVSRLKTRRGTALKTFLVVANQVFMHGHRQNHAAPSHDLSHYSAEDISDAVSRLISLHRDVLGLRGRDWALTDPQALNPMNTTYSQDLIDALRLNEFVKAETLIDGLPYEAEPHPDGVVIHSTDPDIEKSVRLGYVLRDIQVIARQQAIAEFWRDSGEPVSFEQVCATCYDKVLEQFLELKPRPHPHLVLHIPAVPGLFDPIASDQYFKEDVLNLIQLGVESYEDLETEPFEVVKGVRSIDLFKVNRLFTLLSYAMERAIAALDKEEQEKITLQSVIPCMREEAFLQVLGCVLPPDLAQRVFQLLKLDDSREHIDLQYTPFISVEGWVVIAPALVAQSNLVRNIACANKLQEDRIGAADPMQRAVSDALRDAGFLVAEEVPTIAAQHDIDVLAYRDGRLYAFECKNAYHPCNVHEARNSYDHIQKAGAQLSLRRQWIGHPANQAALFAKLGWQVQGTAEIRTGILIANRVFTGAAIEGHPVRQAHEFINLLLRGEVRQSDGRTFALWDGESLSTDDIDRYLSAHGLSADHFAAMKPIHYDYPFGPKTLRFDSWYFDLERQREIVAGRYKATDRSSGSV